jgi:hypothetical protein
MHCFQFYPLCWFLATVNLHPVTRCCPSSNCLSQRCRTMFPIQREALRMGALEAMLISVRVRIHHWAVFQALEAPTPTLKAHMGAMGYQVWNWKENRTEVTYCKIWGFHGSGYEEWSLLGYNNPVCTSQETHYVSTTESSQLMLWKIWGFLGGGDEERRLLGCYTVWLL